MAVVTCAPAISPVFIFMPFAPLFYPCRAPMPPVGGQNTLTDRLYHDGKTFLMFAEMSASPLSYIQLFTIAEGTQS